MKKKISVLLSLMLFVMMFSNVTQLSAVSYEPGCEKDDYVKLEFTGNYSEMQDYWIKIKVLDVNNANNNVSFRFTLNNGTTSESNNTWIKVTDWEMEVGYAFFFAFVIGSPPIIAGDLNAGDTVSSESSSTINETTDVNLGGNSYTVNKLQESDEDYVLWHKKTGLLLKTHFISSSTLYEWQVTDENIRPGIIDHLTRNFYGLPLFAWIAIGVVALIALIAIFRSGKK